MYVSGSYVRHMYVICMSLMHIFRTLFYNSTNEKLLLNRGFKGVLKFSTKLEVLDISLGLLPHSRIFPKSHYSLLYRLDWWCSTLQWRFHGRGLTRLSQKSTCYLLKDMNNFDLRFLSLLPECKHNICVTSFSGRRYIQSHPWRFCNILSKLAIKTLEEVLDIILLSFCLILN